MDLTPPSLTTSPSSPLQKSIESPPPFLFQSYCMPENTSSDIYPSLPLLDGQSYIPPPYGSMDNNALSQSMDADTSLTSLDAVHQTTVSWNSPSVTAPDHAAVTTASSVPGMLAGADYDHFASCLPATYGSSAAYQRHASQSPAYLRTPPPSSTDVTGRAASFSSRPSFSYVQDMGSKPKVPDTLSYGTPSASASPYPNYQSARPRFSSNPQIYGEEYQTQPSVHGQSPMHNATGHVPTNQYQAQGPPSQIVGSSSVPPSSIPEPGSRAWTRLKTKRKPARKHTTKEEANFQCMVKGCGKFFSRSYNFKSHMETHDEKREYPFPCQVPNCTKKFVRKTDLQRHHQSVHTKERNHKCDFCGRLFARKDTQRRHMEDGCSKRFDIGMLDATAQGYALGRATSPNKLPSAVGPAGMSHAVALNSVHGLGLGRGLGIQGTALSHRMDR